MHKVGSIVSIDSEAVEKRIQKWRADPKVWTGEMDFEKLASYFDQRGITKTEGIENTQEKSQQLVEFLDGYTAAFFPNELILIRCPLFGCVVTDDEIRHSAGYHDPTPRDIDDILVMVKGAILDGATRIDITETEI